MQRGFTLVELSIVLVIIGLLTGGILAGQSLVRASEMRSVSADIARYRTAAYAFRDKYFHIPGDMPNATQFWGTLGGTGSDATCQNTDATGMPTCNGDGGGTLVSTSGVSSAEVFRFWQHLANAGLVEGTYTGKVAAASPFWRPGTNVPAGKRSNTYFRANNQLGYWAGNAFGFAGDYGNAQLQFVNNAGHQPEYSWNVDTKLDDGQPHKGIIYADKGNGTTSFCTTVAGVAPPGDATAAYNLASTSNDCFVLYLLRLF